MDRHSRKEKLLSVEWACSSVFDHIKVARTAGGKIGTANSWEQLNSKLYIEFVKEREEVLFGHILSGADDGHLGRIGHYCRVTKIT